ncbi:unnamed protein product [Polarella glacialis]|uniref:Protein unc-45 homolog B n=1 Tax=Polarella glacialis TaxID=89957 RepID=A0A813GLB6_POLGL|nr:unnamed protein product [Polarella glacialis]
MEADMKSRQKKTGEKAKTAEKCRLRGNEALKEGDYVGAIEHYEEGLEYKRDSKALWTNKALAEIKVFRFHEAITSCNKVIEYAEIFEEGFTKNADACFKAFTRRAMAFRALHRWEEALLDIDDALNLFPRDKEARDLRDKTHAACEEARQAKKLQAVPPAAAEVDAALHRQEPLQVRVEIEESDDEDENDVKLLEPSAQAGSLAGLSKQEFGRLLKRLKEGSSERVLFCARRGGESQSAKPKPASDRWVGRKIDMKVEEIAEPSQLDGVLKDAERCLVLWKKRRPNAEGKILMQDDEPEAREADVFVSTCIPRVLAVLHILASNSDHHCALTAQAVRYIWPLLASDSWRYEVTQLLMEWSQRSISSKAMAEFAGRYPDPHIPLLIEMLKQDTKKAGVLHPGFEDRAKKAADRLELGQQSVEDAMEDVLQGLLAHSPLELAISTLGNLCLAGQASASFKEQAAAFCSDLVDGLAQHLSQSTDPLSRGRICGRAAGAICNVLRLGEAFAVAVQEKCTKSLVEALREECQQGGGNSVMQGLLKEGGTMPFATGAKARVLGALVNLVIVRPTALAEIRELRTLEVLLPLIEIQAQTSAEGCAPLATSTDEEGGPRVVAIRATLLTSRLLGADAASLPQDMEADLLRRLQRMLGDAGDFSAVKACIRADIEAPDLEWLDPVVRILTIVLTKTPGAFDRLVARLPRCEEIPEGADEPSSVASPSVKFEDLIEQLMNITAALQPRQHVAPENEGATPSRMRGNLALLFGFLSEEQAKEDPPPVLRELGLSSMAELFVDMLRRERGSAQHNIGVCVTKLALNPRYRQKVRDLNGLETLHQIQLPKVQARKSETMRLHRLETSAEDKKAEILRRFQQQAPKGGQ